MDTMQPGAVNDNFNDADPSKGSICHGPVVLDALGALSIDVPPPCHVRDADYVRVMDDLMLSQHGQHRVILVDFFKGTMQPDLRDETGCRMPGNIACLLAVSLGPSGPEEPSTAAPDRDPVGRIASLNGCASVIRQGVRLPVARGNRIYTGDVLQTAENARLGLTFSDGSSMATGENARLVLTGSEAHGSALGRRSREARLFLVAGSFVAVGTSGIAVNGRHIADRAQFDGPETAVCRSGTTDNPA